MVHQKKNAPTGAGISANQQKRIQQKNQQTIATLLNQGKRVNNNSLTPKGKIVNFGSQQNQHRYNSAG